MAMNYWRNEIYILTVTKCKGKILRFKYYPHNCGFSKLHSIKSNNYFENSEIIMSIFANDRYHLIRHQWNNQSYHHIYDPETNRSKVHPLNNDYHGVSLIFSESQKELMLFKKLDCVRTYSLYDKKWSDSEDRNMSKLHNITPYVDRFGFFLTQNAKYLAMFGDQYSIIFGDEYWNEEGTIHDVNDIQIVYTQTPDNDGTDVYDLIPISMKDFPSEYFLSLQEENITDPFLHGFLRICYVDNCRTEIPDLPREIMMIIMAMAEKQMFVHMFNVY